MIDLFVYSFTAFVLAFSVNFVWGSFDPLGYNLASQGGRKSWLYTTIGITGFLSVAGMVISLLGYLWSLI